MFGQGVAMSAIVAAVYGSLSLFLASLAGRRAVAAALIVLAFLITAPMYPILYVTGNDTVEQVAGVVSPSTLTLGVAKWLFNTDADFDIGQFGPVYGAVTVVLTVVLILLLQLRYRKVAR
jgi:ABC-2 type transport system permease protein